MIFKCPALHIVQMGMCGMGHLGVILVKDVHNEFLKKLDTNIIHHLDNVQFHVLPETMGKAERSAAIFMHHKNQWEFLWKLSGKV